MDVRFTRAFRLGNARDVTVFADVRNVFNFTNVIGLFAETGDVRNQQFEDEQLTDIRNTLSNDAGSLVASRPVTRNGVTRTLTGIDLSNCGSYAYGPGGTRGMPDCLLLRGAERRFGNGDRFFDSVEQSAAFNAYYEGFSGPQFFRGPGRNARIGLELHF